MGAKTRPIFKLLVRPVHMDVFFLSALLGPFLMSASFKKTHCMSAGIEKR